MNWKARLFIYASIACAIAMVVGLVSTQPLDKLGSKEFIAILFFAGAALLSEARAIDFKVGGGSGQPQASLAFIPFLGSTALFPPIVAVMLVGFVCAFSQLVLRSREIERALFNIAQGMISAGLAGLSFYLITDGGYKGGFDGLTVLAFSALVVVFFGSNLLLSTGAIALIQKIRFSEVLGRIAGPGGSNLMYDVFLAPFAAAPVALFDQYGAAGIIVIVFSLEFLRASYLSKQQLIGANQDLLSVLIKAIETRDPYTSGHSVRVAAMAKEVAIDLGITGLQLREIERAALLHDIGKIDAEYAVVIQKPHDLTPEERELIRTHSVRGADLLRSLSSVHDREVMAVRHHHERFDGEGYPDRLKGEAIPLASRIIMICDSVDAMLSDRPYRNALPVEVVRQELLRCAGAQFDPTIVKVMLRQGTLERAAGTVVSLRPGYLPDRKFAVS